MNMGKTVAALAGCWKSSLVAAALCVSGGAFAATMTHAEYSAKKDQISADYKSDKAACDKLSGNEKDVCVKEAKATHEKALADAKLNKKVSAAKKEAAQDKRDADYKVTIEKCDSMSGDAKSACVKAAKQRYGKS